MDVMNDESTDAGLKSENTITASHINELIDSNKTLRETVISLEFLLEQQPRHTSYPPISPKPRRPELERNQSYQNRGSSVLNGRLLDQSHAPNFSDEDRRQRQYQERWRKSRLMSVDEIYEERSLRRKAYESRWDQTHEIDRSTEKCSQKCPSLLPLYSPWWDLVTEPLNNRVLCNSSPESVTSLRSALLQREMKLDLVIAVCGFEFDTEWCNSFRADFENSRKHRLRDIISKLMRTRAIEYFGNGMIRILVEVAEWTRNVWVSKSGGMWLLESLRSHCYERRLLQQPGIDEYLISLKQCEGLLAMIYALDFRRWVNITGRDQWEKVVLELEIDTLPLEDLLTAADEVISRADPVKARNHEIGPAQNISIQDGDLHVKNLRDIGNLEIFWTNKLDDHLRVSFDAKQIFVFQYPTWLLGRQPESRSVFDPRLARYSRKFDGAFHDLAQSYAVLFGPVTTKERKLYQHLQKKSDSSVLDLAGLKLLELDRNSHLSSDPLLIDPLHLPLHLDPNQSPTKEILENFRTSRATGFQDNNNKADDGHMVDILKKGPPYSDDMLIIMMAILRYSEDTSSIPYSETYFEEQLRILKAFMNGKKPRTISQLWKDARDATSWWTFWAVLFFGSATLLLALGSFAVGVAQTVATFEALPP